MHLLIYQEGFICFAQNEKKKRKQEWESHKIALDIMKESKGKHPKQPDKKERQVAYSQMAQNMEKTRKRGQKFHKLSIYYFSRRATNGLN